MQAGERLYAFKVYKSLHETLPPSTEAVLRRHLASKGANVAKPYKTSEDTRLRDFPWAWSLDEFVTGSTLGSRTLKPIWARRLGRTLRILHDLDPGELETQRGLQRSAPSVVAQCFGTDYLRDIERRASASDSANNDLFQSIFEGVAGDRSEPSICHADLHRNQLIVEGGEGADLTLVDFGEARICSRNWDLAALLIKFGLDPFRQVAVGYGLEEALSPHVLSYARCLAIAHASISRSSVSRRAAKQFLRSARDWSSLQANTIS